jgi:hypothetical protein
MIEYTASNDKKKKPISLELAFWTCHLDYELDTSLLAITTTLNLQLTWYWRIKLKKKKELIGQKSLKK